MNGWPHANSPFSLSFSSAFARFVALLLVVPLASALASMLLVFHFRLSGFAKNLTSGGLALGFAALAFAFAFAFLGFQTFGFAFTFTFTFS